MHSKLKKCIALVRLHPDDLSSALTFAWRNCRRSLGSMARHARPGRRYAVFVWLCWPACFSKPPGCRRRRRRSSFIILVPRWHSLVWLHLMLNAMRWPHLMPGVNGIVAERATLLRCFSTFLFFNSGLTNLMTCTEWRRNLFRMNFRKYYQRHTFLYTNVWAAVRFSTIWLPADVIIGVVFNGWSLTGALNSTLGLQTNEVPAPHFNQIFCVYYIYQLSWRRISSTRDCVWTMHQCLWLTLTLNQLY